MPTLKLFLTALAKKAGFDTEADKAKVFFAALPDTEVPDEVIKGIDNSLISLTDAKNNHPEIKNHYHKQVFDSVDKNMLPVLELYPELAEDVEITGSTGYKKYSVIASKIAELVAKKTTVDPKDKLAVQKEIDKLHQDLAAEKTARTQDKTKFDQELVKFRIRNHIGTLITPHKTIYDDLDPEIKATSIDTILNKALQDNQAKFDFDDKGVFALLKNDGANFYGEDHQQISPSKFIEMTLAKSKLLKVSNGQSAQQPQNGQHHHQQNGGESKPNPNAAVIDLNNQVLKQMEAAAANNGKY